MTEKLYFNSSNEVIGILTSGSINVYDKQLDSYYDMVDFFEPYRNKKVKITIEEIEEE